MLLESGKVGRDIIYNVWICFHVAVFIEVVVVVIVVVVGIGMARPAQGSHWWPSRLLPNFDQVRVALIRRCGGRLWHL